MDAWCTSLQPQNRASMTSVLVTSFSLKNRLTRPCQDRVAALRRQRRPPLRTAQRVNFAHDQA